MTSGNILFFCKLLVIACSYHSYSSSRSNNMGVTHVSSSASATASGFGGHSMTSTYSSTENSFNGNKQSSSDNNYINGDYRNSNGTEYIGDVKYISLYTPDGRWSPNAQKCLENGTIVAITEKDRIMLRQYQMAMHRDLANSHRNHASMYRGSARKLLNSATTSYNYSQGSWIDRDEADEKLKKAEWYDEMANQEDNMAREKSNELNSKARR